MENGARTKLKKRGNMIISHEKYKNMTACPTKNKSHNMTKTLAAARRRKFFCCINVTKVLQTCKQWAATKTRGKQEK